ncbi:organic solute transporter subunit beta [Oryctolagus cuniculus]|uniref:SLC51 subunit beta n=1 Tax=Oryctolagus cuniculus TaxID=9986 RepID=G1SZU9_RABIT|nr:organic solute transporter subunit beta [Oryctolagus cuniculus]XP_008267109.1 organic solute transporter subunit beta [Oryctolagus cuniculus]
MNPTEGAVGAPAGTSVSRELLEEMLWLFRVEDATPWNYSILALTVVVVGISIFLLIRSIQADRNPKMQPLEKETPEVLYLREVRSKDDRSLDNLRETLLSKKPDFAQEQTELKDRDLPSVLIPNPSESDS